MSPPIRVLVVDDDHLVRSALSMVLGGAGDVQVVGEAGDGSEAVRLAHHLTPDVVLMDLRMPGTDGLEATETLLAPGPDHDGWTPAIVVLTTFNTDEYVLRALRAGATGFLLKDTAPAAIVEAVRAAAAGSPTMSASVTRLLIERATAGSSDVDALTTVQGLTLRERHVVAAVGRGLSNAQIGRELNLTPAAVKAQVSRLLTRLQMQSRVQLAVLARDAELV